MKSAEINLKLLKSGNEKAWKLLFKEYYAVMCHLAFQYVKDGFTSESLVSDVMSHLWEIRDQLNLETSLRNYLLKATRNRCLDYLRSFHIRNMESIEPRLFLEEEFYDESQPLGILLSSEFVGKVNEAIDSLPEETRTVFDKSRNEGLKYEEIGKELGISINTVKYHIKRSLLLIRAALDTLSQ